MIKYEEDKLNDEAYIQTKLGHLAWKVFKAVCDSNYDVIKSWLYVQYSVDTFQDLSTEEFEDCQLVTAVCKLADHACITKENSDGYHSAINDGDVYKSIMEHHVAMRQAPKSPRYKHDCERCMFLGCYMQYDLYYCIPNNTPVARYGEDSAYHSGVENFLTFPDIYPHLGQALALAFIKGLRPIEKVVASESVPIPTSPDMAELMVKLGYEYLKQHAPERLVK